MNTAMRASTLALVLALGATSNAAWSAANAVNPDAQLRAVAQDRGWPIHEFRKGRRATVIALPIAAGAGVVAGGVAAGLAIRRRRTFD